jgi:uncharacterized membrane protein
MTAWAQKIDGFARWALRHWLLFANGLVILYAGAPWLSPLAYAAGYPLLGRLLFLAFRPFCHQIPERSFFLFGYQVAYCHREVAMYTTLAVGGLLFHFVRTRIRPIPMRLGWLLLLPMLLDGGTHMIDDLAQLGFRGGGDAPGTINFALRIITGLLFAAFVLLAIYPRMERELPKAGAV